MKPNTPNTDESRRRPKGPWKNPLGREPEQPVEQNFEVCVALIPSILDFGFRVCGFFLMVQGPGSSLTLGLGFVVFF
jgi:hypothetical protein